MDLLRWGDEVKTLDSLDLPPAGRKHLSASELKMAKQLIAEMSGKWDPQDFKDEFRHQVMKLVDKKVKAGKTETVIEPEEEAPESNNVIDLTELLQRSLKGGAKADGTASTQTPAKKPPAKKTATKRPAAKKRASQRKAA